MKKHRIKSIYYCGDRSIDYVPQAKWLCFWLNLNWEGRFSVLNQPHITTNRDDCLEVFRHRDKMMQKRNMINYSYFCLLLLLCFGCDDGVYQGRSAMVIVEKNANWTSFKIKQVKKGMYRYVIADASNSWFYLYTDDNFEVGDTLKIIKQ